MICPSFYCHFTPFIYACCRIIIWVVGQKINRTFTPRNPITALSPKADEHTETETCACTHWCVDWCDIQLRCGVCSTVSVHAVNIGPDPQAVYRYMIKKKKKTKQSEEHVSIPVSLVTATLSFVWWRREQRQRRQEETVAVWGVISARGGGPWRGRVSELPLYWIDLLVTYVVFTLFSVCSVENKWTVLFSNSISAISVVHQLFVLIWKLKWKSIRWESLKSIDFHFNFL